MLFQGSAEFSADLVLGPCSAFGSFSLTLFGILSVKTDKINIKTTEIISNLTYFSHYVEVSKIFYVGSFVKFLSLQKVVSAERFLRLCTKCDPLLVWNQIFQLNYL